VGEKLYFRFIVSRGGQLDINVRVISPSGTILLETLHFSKDGDEGRQEIDVQEEGVYTFCFDNEMSRWTAKVVIFDISTKDRNSKPKELQQFAEDDAAKPLEKSIANMERDLRSISEIQRHLRAREKAHTATQESTYNRVWLFSTMESLVLILLSGAQIYFVRKWFNTRTFIPV